MAITGAHVLLYSAQADELRALLEKVTGWDSVDAGGGWPIYALPPAEIAVHPAEAPDHELTLMCDDLTATMEELATEGVVFDGEPHDEGWGIVTQFMMPGDIKVQLFQPRYQKNSPRER